jgi:hypothetical protein
MDLLIGNLWNEKPVTHFKQCIVEKVVWGDLGHLALHKKQVFCLSLTFMLLVSRVTRKEIRPEKLNQSAGQQSDLCCHRTAEFSLCLCAHIAW